MTNSTVRTGALLLILGAGVSSLTGCSSYTYADAEATPFSVVQTDVADFLGYPAFSYVDREGNWKPLENCGQKSFFAQYHCSTQSGSVTFSYSIDEGRIYRGSVTVDGVQNPMDCAVNEDAKRFLSTTYICIPKEMV